MERGKETRSSSWDVFILPKRKRGRPAKGTRKAEAVSEGLPFCLVGHIRRSALTEGKQENV